MEICNWNLEQASGIDEPEEPQLASKPTVERKRAVPVYSPAVLYIPKEGNSSLTRKVVSAFKPHAQSNTRERTPVKIMPLMYPTAKKGFPKRPRNVIKKKWNEKIYIKDIKIEAVVEETARLKKRFRAKILYKDAEDYKLHNVTVFFGSRKKEYFIDHHDIERLRLDNLRTKYDDIKNPFCAKYWEFYLLNNEKHQTLQEAWKTYLISHLV